MKIISILFLIATALGAFADEAEDKARVVCFGDSITKRGYPALLGEALGVETVNAGVAGHSSAAGLRRMQKDVIDHDPDVVVIFFGTNDARVDTPRVHVPVKEYESNLKEMIKRCEKAKAKVVLCTLPPINQATYLTRHPKETYDKAGGLDKLWESYRQAALRVAKSSKVPVVDLNQLLLDHPGWLSKDGVHPSKSGNATIATLIGREVKAALERK